MSSNNKISNILGTRLPKWLIDQIGTRSNQLGRETRDNDNILFVANRSAWVRLVSSIDINSSSDLNYFQREVGPSIQKPEDLAKQFVLFGGTSKYLRENSYQQRAGIGKDGAYGILGENEIKQFGYRPMPGIQSVTIDTQGKLGSLRSATINFKCWDKAQLDIIDALYFKLGFTMFLEWGHTTFYPNNSNNIQSTETYSIDPFRQGLTKEQIALQITKSILQSDGNYDAMLGMVTNFNFSYNQEGGYDCTLKLMALGILGDSIKINNPTALPPLLPEEILQLSNTLTQLAAEEARKKLLEEQATAKKAQEEAEAKQPSLLRELNIIVNKKDSEPTNQEKFIISKRAGLPNSKQKLTGYYDNDLDYFYKTEDKGWELFILRFGVFIPQENTQKFVSSVTIDTTKLFDELNKVVPLLNEYDTIQSDTGQTTNVIKAATIEKRMLAASEEGYSRPNTIVKRALKLFYTGINGQKYPISLFIEFDSTNNNYPGDNVDTTDVYIKAIEKIKADPNFSVNSFTGLLTNETHPDYGKVDSANSVVLQANNRNFFPSLKLSKTLTVVVQDKRKRIIDDTNRAAGGTVLEKEDVGDVKVKVEVNLNITDTALISAVTKGSEAPDYKIVQANISAQDQGTAGEGEESTDLKPTIDQIKQALQYQSGLELTLRTIQVHALNRAIDKGGLSIGKKVFKLEMTVKEPNSKRPFYEQIFNNGVLSSFIKDLVSGNIKESDSLFKLQSKYGFAAEFMAGRVTAKEMQDNNSNVDFNELLTAYVVPYQISQEIVSGINANHPVYIPFGLLLMILNNICTIYDTKNGTQQTPLVYVDFNPNLNFFLSNTKHLTTNPFKVLIPYEGSFNDYKTIFPKEILNSNQTEILPLSGSTTGTPLFNKDKEDRLSQQLPKVKYDGLQNNLYRGKLMNVLLNIDYLVEVVKDNSTKDGSNNVYLKPFIEQILLDVNKYLGDFSLLRLAYNDGANTFHIVDDQVCPPLPGDTLLQPDNKTEIPLVGRFGLAKNLEIKSEVSSKLANMIAISANADAANKATLSTNGDSFGFVNTGYKDRYIPERRELTGSLDPKKGQLDTLKSAATQFNQTISDFYSTIDPSEGNVPQATNYYIERMSKIKNDEYPTRASSMIPVSVNFTMDGMAGFTMGQAFTISDQLLPYTYNNRIIQSQPGLGKDHINKVGFTIVGLTNTIENNQWNTSVRANMIFLKYATEFTGSVSQVVGITGEFLGTPTNESSAYVNPANVTIPTGDTRKNLVDAINKASGTTGVKMLALAHATIEGYYPNTKAYSNNNPGNIRSTQGPFIQFATLEEGAQALVNYINRAVNKQNRNYINANTLSQYINVYAPAADNNNPNSYIASILGYFKKFGVTKFNANSLISEISSFNDNVNLV